MSKDRAPSRAAPTVRGWAHSQERAALTGKDRGGALVRGQSSRRGGLICRRIAVPVLQSGASGVFLYMGFWHLLIDMIQELDMLDFGIYALGYGLMSSLAIWT